MNVLEYNRKYHLTKSRLIHGNQSSQKFFISIVIPTYNRISLLLNAVESVINQRFDIDVSYEIVIVDNNPDNFNNLVLKKILGEFNNNNIKYYVNDENIGMMSNWNRGLELASGDWVVLLHDDDYLLPNFIETIASDIRSFDTVDAIIHSPLMHDKRKHNDLKLLSNKDSTYISLKPYHLITTNYHISSIVVKKATTYKIGGFDESMYPLSDYDFTVKLVKDFNVLLVNEHPLAVIVIQENETLNPNVFENWFEKETIIKNNTVVEYPKIIRQLASGVIDAQINSNIEHYVRELMFDEIGINLLRSKKKSVTVGRRLMLKLFNRLLLLNQRIFRRKYKLINSY